MITIYKRTSTGTIQTWEVEVVDNKYRTISGKLNGKMVTSKWTICKPKNVGKANETTGASQARAEAEAMHIKKLSRGYSTTIEHVDSKEKMDPMTAKGYADNKKKLTFPVFVQPKLDGMRCAHRPDELRSRGDKHIYEWPNIFSNKVKNYPNVKFVDGELYNHELKADFDAIMSLAKKQTPTAAELAETNKSLFFYVYDIYIPNMIFSERYKYLTNLVKEINYANWILVPTYVANSFEELDVLHEQFIADGYEGSIIRLDGFYENKKSKYLLKRKDFMDDEFILLDILEGEGNKSGMAGYIRVQLKNGQTCKSNIVGPWPFLKKLLENKNDYIGHSVTIKFQNYTPDGSLRIPYATKFNREEYEKV